MSLDADWTKVDPELKAKFSVNEGKNVEWVRMQSLIHLTMGVGMGDITEKNWMEFYARVRIWEKCFGAMMRNGEGESVFITPADVKAHIGLHTNVQPKHTDAEFRKRIFDGMMSDGRWDARKWEDEQ